VRLSARNRSKPVAPRQVAAARERDDAALVARKTGVYREAQRRLPNVLLVTASNSDYRLLLLNWECAASRLDLQWLLIAMDQRLIEERAGDALPLPGRQTVPSAGSAGAHQFRSRAFNAISCTKLTVVRHLLHKYGVDVVFSDPDNVFVRDPFAESLGGLIQQRLDYVYADNEQVRLPRTANCLRGRFSEGNTGFYFASARKREGMLGLFDDALRRCQSQPQLDDQAHFWAAVPALSTTVSRRSTGAFRRLQHCDYGRGVLGFQATANDTLALCCLDPATHVPGTAVRYALHEIVTYHANYVAGGARNKITKLRDHVHGGWLLGTANECPPAATPLGALGMASGALYAAGALVEGIARLATSSLRL